MSRETRKRATPTTPAENPPKAGRNQPKVPSPAAYLNPGSRPLYLNDSVVNNAPVTLDQLDFALRQARHALEGCKTVIDRLEEINRDVEFSGPLIMLGVTLDFAISHISGVVVDDTLPEVAE